MCVKQLIQLQNWIHMLLHMCLCSDVPQILATTMQEPPLTQHSTGKHNFWTVKMTTETNLSVWLRLQCSVASLFDCATCTLTYLLKLKARKPGFAAWWHGSIPSLPWLPGKDTATSFIRQNYKRMYLIHNIRSATALQHFPHRHLLFALQAVRKLNHKFSSNLPACSISLSLHRCVQHCRRQSPAEVQDGCHSSRLSASSRQYKPRNIGSRIPNQGTTARWSVAVSRSRLGGPRTSAGAPGHALLAAHVVLLCLRVLQCHPFSHPAHSAFTRDAPVTNNTLCGQSIPGIENLGFSKNFFLGF